MIFENRGRIQRTCARKKKGTIAFITYLDIFRYLVKVDSRLVGESVIKIKIAHCERRRAQSVGQEKDKKEREQEPFSE